MIKKGIVFMGLSVMVLAIFLVISNISSIWGAITAVPMPWVVSYILGALTMFVALTLIKISPKKPKE